MTGLSVCSASGTSRSSGSSKYRRVARKSTVDERRSPNHNNAPTAKNNENPIQAPQVTIASSDLKRIQQSLAPSRTNQAPSTSPESKQDVGKARKEHMKRLELLEIEKQRNARNQIDNEKLDRIRREAQEKINEDEDLVKLLMTCSERAKTFSIRDQQLKDKAEREKKERDYEQRMILAMEVDRLKEIEARELEEAEKMKRMIDGRKIIEHQIAERHQAKLLAEEARDKENREMLDRIKSYQLQDEERARIRRENAARAREEIIRANDDHIRSKNEHRLMEKKEDEAMVAYQMEQDEKLRQREAEEEEADRKKRELQKRLLDEQERTLDRRAEIDELRARRAVEDAERKYRQKQLMEAQKRKHDMDTLDQARIQQQKEREEKEKLEQAEKQREYENALRHAQTMAERERVESERERRKNAELISNLQKQIEENREQKMEQQKEKYREGISIKQQLEVDRAKLEAVRAKIVEDMRLKGVDERYYGEMLSLDINKYL
ncbi:hypothetical protein ACHAWO_010687 [Cyclotella atomus]|uniref:Cilia- and flagella-associated protein 45 n=1 Tax=Cyclotella atomus TaxID=382360 RepID=A0ABD3QV45_9STRA